MQKSTILLLISVLFLTSCGKKTLTKEYGKVERNDSIYQVRYFANAKTDYVYKTNISVYGNEFSGLFVIKKIGDAAHRVAFTTEFGNKLIDFEISETQFKLNSIVSELDKKMFVNTLRDDFRLLLRSTYSVSEQFESATETVYKCPDGRRFNYLYISKTNGRLTKIVQSTLRKDKIVVGLDSDQGTLAQKITVEHKNIDLKIVLNYLNQ